MDRRQMKAKPRVKKRGTIRSLKAAAAEGKRGRGLPEDIAEYYRPIKKAVTLRLDADVLAWFKAQGRGYQTRINRALRNVMRQGKPQE